MNEIIKQNISLLKRNDEMAKEISKLKGLNLNLKKLLSKLLKEDLNISKSIKKAKDKETQTEPQDFSPDKSQLKEILMDEIINSMSSTPQKLPLSPMKPLRISTENSAQSAFIASPAPPPVSSTKSTSASSAKSIPIVTVNSTHNSKYQFWSPEFNQKESEIPSTHSYSLNVRSYKSTPKSKSARKQENISQSISPIALHSTYPKGKASTNLDASFETISGTRTSRRLSRSVKKPVSYKDTPLNSKIRRGFQFFQFEESTHQVHDQDNESEEREKAALADQINSSASSTQGMHTPTTSPRSAYNLDTTEGSSEYFPSSEYEFVSKSNEQQQQQSHHHQQGKDKLYRSINKAYKEASDHFTEAYHL